MKRMDQVPPEEQLEHFQGMAGVMNVMFLDPIAMTGAVLRTYVAQDERMFNLLVTLMDQIKAAHKLKVPCFCCGARTIKAMRDVAAVVVVYPDDGSKTNAISGFLCKNCNSQPFEQKKQAVLATLAATFTDLREINISDQKGSA